MSRTELFEKQIKIRYFGCGESIKEFLALGFRGFGFRDFGFCDLKRPHKLRLQNRWQLGYTDDSHGNLASEQLFLFTLPIFPFRPTNFRRKVQIKFQKNIFSFLFKSNCKLNR